MLSRFGRLGCSRSCGLASPLFEPAPVDRFLGQHLGVLLVAAEKNHRKPDHGDCGHADKEVLRWVGRHEGESEGGSNRHGKRLAKSVVADSFPHARRRKRIGCGGRRRGGHCREAGSLQDAEHHEGRDVVGEQGADGPDDEHGEPEKHHDAAPAPVDQRSREQAHDGRRSRKHGCQNASVRGGSAIEGDIDRRA